MTRVVRITAFVLLLSLIAFAQASHDLAAETNASVPALNDFHTVISTIWHQAWPAKDAALLRKLSPDVEKGISEIAAAKLPGILREKQTAWNDNVAKLKAIGTEFKSAAAGTDDAKLFAAAEQLHTRYEGLVRVVRPPLKELEQFHAVLYPLYHYYLPKYDLAQIKTSTAELEKQMAALKGVTLPDRLKSKQESFVTGRDKLSNSVTNLKTTIATNDEPKVKAAIESMHADYENLAKIFE